MKTTLPERTTNIAELDTDGPRDPRLESADDLWETLGEVMAKGQNAMKVVGHDHPRIQPDHRPMIRDREQMGAAKIPDR